MTGIVTRRLGATQGLEWVRRLPTAGRTRLIIVFPLFSDPTLPLKNLSEGMLLIITLLVEQAENYRCVSEQLKFKFFLVIRRIMRLPVLAISISCYWYYN
jgi:hypothetical protein